MMIQLASLRDDIIQVNELIFSNVLLDVAETLAHLEINGHGFKNGLS